MRSRRFSFLQTRKREERVAMRQRNGSDLFGAQDSRGAAIGIIDVAPEDERQSLLTAILTQDKLGRKQTVIVIPQPAVTFRRSSHFKDFESTLQGLQTQLVFVVPSDSNFARLVRQRHYLVFPSLEDYTQYARTFLHGEASSNPVEESEQSKQEQHVENTPVVDPAQRIEEDPALPVVSPLEKVAPDSPAKSDTEKERPLKASQEPDDVSLVPTVPIRNKAQSGEEAVNTPPSSHAPLASLAYPFAQSNAEMDDEQKQVGDSEVPAPDRPASPMSSPLDPVSVSSPPARTPHRRSRRFLFALLLLFVLLIVGSALSLSGIFPLAQFVPGITSATVTITPDSKSFNKIYPIVAVSTLPDTSKRQIQARYLSYVTAPQTRTVNATGKGLIPAVHARGELTFYNALGNEQRIPAGTVLTDENGVQVVTDEPAIIEATQLPSQGAVTVPARALVAGEAGNIPAFSFERLPCCQPGITVVNMQAFRGGQNAVPYTYVQQSDIDVAANALKPALLQGAQNTLKSQILSTEQLIDPVRCDTHVTANAEAGERKSNVTTVVTVTCTGQVYDRQGALALAEDTLKMEGAKEAGANYVLTGPIKTTIVDVTREDKRGTVLVHVRTEGFWLYHLPASQKTELLLLIKGRHVQEAQNLLLQQRGVKAAKIDLFLANADMLPGDIGRIAITIQSAS